MLCPLLYRLDIATSFTTIVILRRSIPPLLTRIPEKIVQNCVVKLEFKIQGLDSWKRFKTPTTNENVPILSTIVIAEKIVRYNKLKPRIQRFRASIPGNVDDTNN